MKKMNLAAIVLFAINLIWDLLHLPFGNLFTVITMPLLIIFYMVCTPALLHNISLKEAYRGTLSKKDFWRSFFLGVVISLFLFSCTLCLLSTPHPLKWMKATSMISLLLFLVLHPFLVDLKSIFKLTCFVFIVALFSTELFWNGYMDLRFCRYKHFIELRHTRNFGEKAAVGQDPFGRDYEWSKVATLPANVYEELWEKETKAFSSPNKEEEEPFVLYYYYGKKWRRALLQVNHNEFWNETANEQCAAAADYIVANCDNDRICKLYVVTSDNNSRAAKDIEKFTKNLQQKLKAKGNQYDLKVIKVE